MKISGLKDLYKSMKQQNIERYKFDFIYQNVKFDVLYFIDETPNKLAFGIKQHNYYFEVPVKNGFEVTAFIYELSKFCKIMGFTYDPKNRYKPAYFFEEFNKNVPKEAHKRNVPKPSDIAIYRNKVEESEKIYFKGWLDNNLTGKHVRLENLEKTRALLSYSAYLMCKSKNISSRWSHKPIDEIPFYLPNT